MMRDWWEQGATRIAAIVVLTCIILVALYALMSVLPFGRISFSSEAPVGTTTAIQHRASAPVLHMQTPAAVKAIYMTACIAGDKNLRDNVLSVMQGTELNALVIDYKDYTGTISYAPTSLQAKGQGDGCRIPDLPAFITELHSKGIYVIGRITTFQDPLYASTHLSVAIRSKAHPNKPWTDPLAWHI